MHSAGQCSAQRSCSQSPPLSLAVVVSSVARLPVTCLPCLRFPAWSLWNLLDVWVTVFHQFWGVSAILSLLFSHYLHVGVVIGTSCLSQALLTFPYKFYLFCMLHKLTSGSGFPFACLFFFWIQIADSLVPFPLWLLHLMTESPSISVFQLSSLQSLSTSSAGFLQFFAYTCGSYLGDH